MNKQFLALIIAVVLGSTISETMFAIAESNGNISQNNTTALNSTNSGGMKLVITWMESNKTNADSAPVISISNEDFWKIFGPLLELSTNKTSGTIE